MCGDSNSPAAIEKSWRILCGHIWQDKHAAGIFRHQLSTGIIPLDQARLTREQVCIRRLESGPVSIPLAVDSFADCDHVKPGDRFMVFPSYAQLNRQCP